MTSSVSSSFSIPALFNTNLNLPSLDAAYASAKTQLEVIENWAEESPQHAIITTVVFATLGITIVTVGVTVVATVTHAAIVAASSLLCFGACGTIGYYLVRNALAAVQGQTKSSVEEVQGSPPNIPLTDVQAQIQYRVQVMNETLTHLKAGFYTSPNGTRQPLDLNPAALGATAFHNAGSVLQHPGNEQTRISVKNKDCLYAAAELQVNGLNPIVLDMANGENFGGGYLIGARAQEEDCCRRTGLALAMDIKHGVQRQNFYPLNRNLPYAGIYVPRVPVFRAGYDKGYQYLNRPFEVAFGVVAAPVNPPLHPSPAGLRMNGQDALLSRERIRNFLEMARQKGHQSVVFSAFGCGAFQNPPDQIAEITMDVITKEFPRSFKEIVIAIVEDNNTGQSHNPEGNFKPFARRALTAGGKVFDTNGRELTQV